MQKEECACGNENQHVYSNLKYGNCLHNFRRDGRREDWINTKILRTSHNNKEIKIYTVENRVPLKILKDVIRFASS